MTSPAIRSAVFLVLAIGLLFASSGRIAETVSNLPPHDFVEYWAAGHLQATGGNPYDPERLYELQRDHIGWDPVGQAIMMWNPPWTLSFVTPLGLLPWRTAMMVWLVARLAMLIVSAWLLAQVYSRQPWFSWAIILTWLPCLIALQFGQIPPLMLLGGSLFLWLMKRDRPFLAGMACVLLAVKPHLFAFLWLGIARHAIVRGEWRIIAGGILGGLLASIGPLLQNPAVFHQYLEATRTVPPVQWVSPTIGAWLRVMGGTTAFWPQWIPLGAGLVWFAIDSLRHRAGSIARDFPKLLVASLLCAPYGCWPYDLAMLAIPWIAVANRRVRKVDIVLYAAISLGIVAMTMTEVEAAWFVWVVPGSLVAMTVSQRLGKADCNASASTF
jgi:hypothetical protein